LLNFIVFCLRRKCTGKNGIVNRKFYFFENKVVGQNFIWWAVFGRGAINKNNKASLHRCNRELG
jgi:hypothetical protein